MEKRASHIFRWSCVAATLGLAPSAVAQVPVESSDGQAVVCNRRGPLHRLFHHSAHTLQDKFVGYPENFVEPPLGSYINEQFAVQVAKADAHRFTLYRSDFLPGTSVFSPVGASRYNIMATRIPGWVGPITIEWTPEQPELAQARRQAIVDTLNKAGQTIVADRVVIAPSPYPGMMGTEAMNNFNNTIARTQLAAPTFALPPTETAASGVR
jgi:hypothetical protein